MAAHAARRSSGPVIRSISPSSTFSRRYSANSPPPSFNSPSPNRFISVSSRVEKPSLGAGAVSAPIRRSCLCSPTNHPGSFRCSLHKGSGGSVSSGVQQTAAYGSSSRLNMRRSAMKNSLVRIGTVEGGDWVRRALAALIRPSSHQQRRRGDFHSRPSRLSVMSGA